MEIIRKYFPELTPLQDRQLSQLSPLYSEWNSKINVISRNDIANLYEKHVLHSLSVLKFMQFGNHLSFLDVGTGGGFPGIPLAIMLPACHFTLTDSIGKKIKVVNEIATAIGLKNVNAVHSNVTQLTGKYDVIVSRAVTALPGFMNLINGKTKEKGKVVYLKGGDFSEELSELTAGFTIYDIKTVFEETFFDTKKIVCITY